MTKTDILKKALLESTLKEIRAIEAMDYPKIKTDEAYDNKIYEAIRHTKTKRYPRRAAIIVAAILVCLTMMMSISAIRTKVIDFVVSIYEKFVCLSIDETSSYYPTSIEKVYRPHYVPQEYIENTFTVNTLTTKIIWKHINYEIRFYQNVISNKNIKLDNEDSEYLSTYIENTKVYYTLKNNKYTIRWLSDEYSFMLSCDESLSWEEIEKILLSIEEVPFE